MLFLKNKKDPKNQPIKMYGCTKKVMLFTNARNEKNIKEWASHHLLIGFDIIVIFDHKSDIPLKKVFFNFDKRVIVIPCNLESSVKIPLMKKACMMAKTLKMDWFIYLDADEFIILNKFIGIKKMLNYFPFAHSLSLNWLMFGTNHLIKDQPGLIIENFTKSEDHLDKHVKTFVRPNEVLSVVNPHYYNMKHQECMFNIDKKRMDPNIGFAFHHSRLSINEVPAFIAHYIYQSEETYLRRKIHLPQDDTGIMRSRDEKIHLLYNNVDNEIVKNKYTFLIKKLLDQYTI